MIRCGVLGCTNRENKDSNIISLVTITILLFISISQHNQNSVIFNVRDIFRTLSLSKMMNNIKKLVIVKTIYSGFSWNSMRHSKIFSRIKEDVKGHSGIIETY